MTEECAKVHFCLMEDSRLESLIFQDISDEYFIFVLWQYWKIDKGCYFEWWAKQQNPVGITKIVKL